MALKTYDSAEVQVVVGTRRLKGLAEGSFVTLARDEDSFTKQVGADGEVTRSKSNNRSGTITLVLQQTSEDNAYLQQLANDDENTGLGVIPVKVIDKFGTYVGVATEAWIQKPADMEFGRDAADRTWPIQCATLDLSGGGN